MSGGSPGTLPDDADPDPAADQRGKSGPESAARLARMLGRDASEAEHSGWGRARALLRRLPTCRDRACGARSRRARTLAPSAPVIGAGCGGFAASSDASAIFRSFAEIIDTVPEAREMADAALQPSPSPCSPRQANEVYLFFLRVCRFTSKRMSRLLAVVLVDDDIDRIGEGIRTFLPVPFAS